VIDHRRVQRTLFRMQLAPEFAAALAARESEAVRSTGLAGAALELVLEANAAGLSADCEGRRRAQFLRNVSQEFALTLAAAGDARLLESFTGSPEFHQAVANDESLPLALASHLAASHASPLLELESALARARRARRSAPALAPGEVALAPWVELLELPEGTLAVAEAVRAALDAGSETPDPFEPGSARETLLLRRDFAPPAFGLASVELERVSPALASFLARAAEPMTPAHRAVWAGAESLAPAELETIVAELIADRVLIGG
jgi:hypothetical protein